MKALLKLPILFVVLLFCQKNQSLAQEATRNEIWATNEPNYIANRPPLIDNPYLELPLGSIEPKGWLKEQLQRMASGMTGKLDSIYPQVVGDRNGWLGGNGDGWERGPYWIDGLLPLAYILDDEKLKLKAKKWVDWTIENQTDEGYIGPVPFETKPKYEPGLQRGQRRDWWPKMVMLKILQQYYNATQDPRVIETLTKYFKYQLKELPIRPLDADTFWANRRGGDNLQVVHWLYNVTGDDFLLELGKLIEEQTFPWAKIYTNSPGESTPLLYTFGHMKGYPFDSTEIASINLSDMGSIHTVNFAQGLKQPALQYQVSNNAKYITALKEGLANIKKFHGQPQGMYGGDEPLHGTNPVQGVEFCSISEEMFSLETIIKITGDMEFADLLEKITYNALPVQASDDFTSRQYFQAANQIALKADVGVSFEMHNHNGTDFVYGTLTGYPCCTTNMHQSWPKFVQNLFYATADHGVAALQYAPSTVKIRVADGQEIMIKETTGFPFRDKVDFHFSMQEKSSFPFHLRIPDWTENATISINGENIEYENIDGVTIINRRWSHGDRLQLHLPMTISTSTWHEFSTAIERGPLVYALRIEGKETRNSRDGYGEFTEVVAETPWNYGLLQKELDQLPKTAEVIENEWNGDYPWNLENSPVTIYMKGIQIPEWEASNGIPYFPAFWGNYLKGKNPKTEKISLVPYGCTTLRISEFPTYR